MTDLSILALSGSLRAESFNTALLRAAGELAPDGVHLTLHDLREVPLYDGDLEAAGVFPWPELLVSSASGKFEDGRLTDEATREVLKDYMRGFTAWVAKQRA